jgi:CDP-6-deoxy-D-xylo-4-hexulose-3-dehydrase
MEERKLSDIRAEILRLTREYSKAQHGDFLPAEDPDKSKFEPGEHHVPYAGRVFNHEEVENAVAATLDFWLTLGQNGERFEKELASFIGVRNTILVNSGSSANLLAVATLQSHKLPKDRRLLPGDEVITVAAGFPTTVAAILQLGCVAVFVDANPITANLVTDHLKLAYRKGVTKAVILAHALGNPFNISEVLSFCRENNLWLIEDNCDALGATYTLPVDDARSLGLDHLVKLAVKKPLTEPCPIQPPFIENNLLTAYTGSFGDLSTQSFYPPHHITLGEGGAVSVPNNPALKLIAESLRDWGRDCWCPSGKDNTCNKRYSWKLGELPEGYDHKYIYSHLGYNLKPLDIQAAIGLAQIKKLPDFIRARRENWELIRTLLDSCREHLAFCLPTHAISWTDGTFTWEDASHRTSPSWFGFMIQIKSDRHTAQELAKHLEQKKVGNRMFFGGNLLRQPAFVVLRNEAPNRIRVIGDLSGADQIMRNALFVGTYPGLTEEMIRYQANSISEFFLT